MQKPNNALIYASILACWLFATFWNIDKAFHMDDAGHMEIARWITVNPLKPMSGLINWRGIVEPISELNQPHLYFYLMAAWGSIFGNTEISMHLLMSIFSLWAIIAFYRLAKIFVADEAITATALFSCSAAFVVGQNSMVDIPLLAVWLEFYYSLLNPRYTNKMRYFLAGILCAAALLIKYTSLVLLPAMLLLPQIQKKYKNSVWILIPILALGAWALFNIYDFGSIHILGREMVGLAPAGYLLQGIGWIATLGSVMPFAVIFFASDAMNTGDLRNAWPWQLVGAACLATPLFVASTLLLSVPSTEFNIALFVTFFMAGAGAICLLFKKVSRERHVKAELIIPVYWIVSGCAFVVFLAPFMASRHVLLVMPVFLLLLYPQIKHSKNSNANRIVRTIALLLTLANTTLLAKADHWYANIYREAAYVLKSDIPPGAGIWFMGHWGWQWYAQQAGMRQLSPNSLSPRMGDYLVIPLNVDGGDPPPQLILEEMKTVSVAREYWYQRFASSNFYISPWLSWGYSEALMENFKIYRIQGSRQP